MTKLKNTKKGMAKKALSISLVAAMLATSNVPVWAAEFSDGADVAPVVVEETTDVETFSAGETEDVVAPAEEVVDPSGTYAAADGVCDFSKVTYDTNFDWGKNTSPFKSGSVISYTDDWGNKHDDALADDFIGYVYLLDGKEVTGYINTTLATELNSNILTKDAIGSTLTARFYRKYNDNGEYFLDRSQLMGEINFGTIQAKQIEDAAKAVMAITRFGYTGILDEASKIPEIKDINGSTSSAFTANDFNWSYTGSNGSNVGTVKVVGTLKAEKAAATGYTGSIETSYEIVPQTNFNSEWLLKDITINNAQAGEYTGENITLDKSAVTVKIKGTDITLPVKKVETTNKIVGQQTVKITFDKDALNASGNFNLDAEPVITTTDKKVTISARDLSKGSAALNVTYAVGDIKNENSVLPKRVNITGVNGKVLTADKIAADITIKVVGSLNDYKTPGTYANAVKIEAKSVEAGQTANVIGTVYADLVISEQSFKDEAKFLGTEGSQLSTNPATATLSKPFTGEAIEIAKDKLGKFSPDGSETTAGDQSAFTITYKNNVNASTSSSVASITVTGNTGTDYAGCSKTFYFKIAPANVTVSQTASDNTVSTSATSTKQGVSFIAAAADAQDYKAAVGLAIKAKNTASTPKTFDLVEGTDYTAVYSYVDKNGNKLDPDADQNAVGNQIKIVATIKNTNYKLGGSVATINGVKITPDNSKNTVTLLVPILKKTLENAEITLDKDSYVFTGKTITPVVTVTVDGKTLKEGKDYEVSVRDAIDAGTATVTVTTLATSDYIAGTKLTKTFTITKAKAEDIVVKVTNDNIKYDGKSWNGDEGRVKYSVLLNGVDVKKYFKVTWGENIDAGKTAGKMTLVPTTTGSKNFEGTKEATFEIKGKTLKGTLTVYSENGERISVSDPDSDDPARGGYIQGEYDYTGTPIKFDKTTFVAADGKKLVEGKDYEITYIDNTDSGQAYVCVTGKGNYVGTAEVETENGTVDNIVAGTAFDFYIRGKRFTAKNVTVKNGVYASGLVVKPNVTIVYGGKTLVEGIDYKCEFDTDKAINATTTQSIRFAINGLGEYNDTWFELDTNGKYLVYGIDKFNLANASVYSDGESVTVRNGSVTVPSSEYTAEIADGKVTVTATTGNKNYEGSKTVDISKEDTYVEAPMIERVDVVGNNATVVLSGESDGATGYDYVISTDRDCITNKDYDKVNKNVLKTNTTFTYTQQGTYYAYCHAWKRVDGVKVFSGWSNAYPFAVSAITPEQPGITSVKVSGTTVTVTYTKSANATGYDIVLGSAQKKVKGELRPVEYGTLVKKIKKGDTVTATFKNVPKGTYYAGLHAWNRTSENGKKVFSPWSNTKRVNVK